MDPTTLGELLAEWGYAAYLTLLYATGVGSPIPEDLLLLTAGYLVSVEVFSWPGAFVLGVFGVVTSDLMLYGWGTRLGSGAPGRRLRRLASPRHVKAATAWLNRFGDVMVFAARLLPGTRAITFIGAGMRDMPIGRFLVFDTLGAIIWVPFVLTLGAALGEEIGGLDRLMSRLGQVGGWLLAAAIVLLVVWHRWRSEESKL